MKFGAIVTDGRGKIGGHVASKNRHGAYLRTKVTPSNGQTSFQQGVRNLFTSLSQGWRSITQAQRDAWNAAVASFSKTDIFGDLRNPSGANLYQKLNNNLIRTGWTAIADPPNPVEVVDITIGALSVAATAGTMSLAYVANALDTSEIEVYATAPLSAGKSFVKSEYRLVTQFTSDSVSPLNMAAAYVSKFGALTGQAGKKIFVKTLAIDSTTGQSSVAQSTYAIIAT